MTILAKLIKEHKANLKTKNKDLIAISWARLNGYKLLLKDK